MLFVRLLIVSGFLLGVTISHPAFAQVNGAQVKASVAKAATFLRGHLQQTPIDNGQSCLAAYALIKAGDAPTSPAVQRMVSAVAKRAKSGNYRPGSDGIYGAGVELMLLEAVDGQKYRTEMEAIVAYLIKHQHSSGAWDYVEGFKGGDTSQCQYAMLGFWAAERVGIKVDPKVWDRGAAWLLRTQNNQAGGFAYHPISQAPADLEVTHTMTAAGVGALMMARIHLYPNADDPNKQATAKTPKTKFGVLETVDLGTPENPDGTKVQGPNDYKPIVSSANLLGGARKGTAWLARNYTANAGRWNLYYLYTLERMAALLDLKLLGGHDWYREGATDLLRSQAQNGSWKTFSGEVPCTAFGILFLTRATAKILDKDIPLDPIGTGLLIGGRGLPDNLNTTILKDGKVETTKDLGPIDQLLAELEKVDSVNVEAAQKAIVEKVQLGDREELIQQKERLVKLAKHPNVEIRRTAIWALGRTEDLQKAKLLLEALDDNDIDVMVEARNALCIMSRKPLGFQLPESPLTGLPENATQAQKDEAVKKWRENLKAKWGAWYYKFRPYKERNDLSEALFKAK